MGKREQERRIKGILARMRTEATLFPDDTDEKKKERVERAKVDVDFFCATYLPHHFDTELSEFHLELTQACQIRGVPVAVAAPSGFGKSTVVSTGYPLYEICRKGRNFIVIGAATEDVATGITRIIKLELEFNERIRNDFGEQKSRKWSDGNFVTRSDIAVIARGKGQAFRGLRHKSNRPDLVILDDIETRQSAASPDQVQEALNWVKSDIIPRMCRGLSWTLVWVNTILARRSAMDLVQRGDAPEYKHWERRFYAAEVSKGVSLCPKMFTWEELQQLRLTLGTASYLAEYMNEPVDKSGLFKEDWFSEYEPAHLAGILSRGLTVAWIDPSVEDSIKHDFKAIITVTRHPVTSEIYVRHAWIRHASIDSMVDASYDTVGRWACGALGLESVAFQKLLERDFDAAAKRHGHHLPLVLRGQTIPKDLRIQSLSPRHERAKIHYPKGFPGDLKILREQLLAYPSKTVKRDGPDALEGAIRLCEETSEKLEYKPLVGRRSIFGAVRDFGRAVAEEVTTSRSGTRGGGW